MELTNFGSVMKFAIDRENDIKTILAQAAANPKLAALSARISEMAAQNLNNLKFLERTRREGVNEVVLHPISGLDDCNYAFDMQSANDLSEGDFLKLIAEAGEKLSRYYADAADELHTDDAKRLFQKMARKRYA